MTAPRTATGRARQAPPPLAPDPAAAGDFLDQWAGLTGVPHATLVRIIPDHPDPRTAAKGRAFRWPADRDEALRWIAANNEHSNIYFSVNTAKSVPKKPLKKDIEALNAVHADVDPQGGTDLGEERERLINLAAELAGRKRPPSFVLDSGGGIQAFFVAAESCPADSIEYVHEVETYNARLACVLGGDITTRNADRIMRVPGTVNWPDQRKRERGRVPTMASLLHASGRTYHWREIADEITALEDEPPEHAAAPFEPRTRFGGHPGGNGAVLEGMPPYPTDDQLKALLENHPEVAAIWDQSTSWPPLDTSPNGWDYRFCSELSFIGFEPDLIGSFLRAYRAHHAPEKGKHDREDYIMRTVEAATARHREEPDEDDGPPFEAGPAGPNGPAGDGGQRQTAGDAKGRNRGTFHAGAKPGADWPEPGVLGEPPAAPEFPTWLLPRVLRRWVEAQAENMGIPAAMLAIPLLVCVAGAIGRDLVLQVKLNDPSWTERPCLWSAVIVSPGNLKSGAIKATAKPLRDAEARQRERWEMDVLAWELRQQRDSKGKIKPDKDDPKPSEPKLVVTDTTIEAVADAMVGSHGLTLIRDELSGWIGNMSRYSKGSDRPFFLECHGGGTYTIDRVLRGRHIVPDLFLNIVGGIQPRVAKNAFKSNLTGEDDGFFVRFGLPCYPDPLPWDGVKDSPLEHGLHQALADAIQGLADANWGNLLAGELLRLDAGARSRFFTWYDGHMRERVRLHEDRQDHGFMAKGEGLVLRIAIALHAFRWKCGEVHEVRLVDLDSVDAAIGMLEAFCLPMYARIYGAFGQVQSHDAAQRVLALIKRKKLTKIRVADIAKLQWKGMRERAPILAALEALEDVDVLRRSAPAPGARVGRPSDHWIVSPKVHA